MEMEKRWCDGVRWTIVLFEVAGLVSYMHTSHSGYRPHARPRPPFIPIKTSTHSHTSRRRSKFLHIFFSVSLFILLLTTHTHIHTDRHTGRHIPYDPLLLPRHIPSPVLQVLIKYHTLVHLLLLFSSVESSPRRRAILLIPVTLKPSPTRSSSSLCLC